MQFRSDKRLKLSSKLLHGFTVGRQNLRAIEALSHFAEKARVNIKRSKSGCRSTKNWNQAEGATHLPHGNMVLTTSSNPTESYVLHTEDQGNCYTFFYYKFIRKEMDLIACPTNRKYPKIDTHNSQVLQL